MCVPSKELDSNGKEELRSTSVSEREADEKQKKLLQYLVITTVIDIEKRGGSL